MDKLIEQAIKNCKINKYEKYFEEVCKEYKRLLDAENQQLNLQNVSVSLPHNDEIQKAAMKYDRRDRSNEPEGADNDDYIGFKAGVQWMLGYMAGNYRNV